MTRRSLTICAVGPSSSAHVVTRTKSFADRGHRVFLITDTRVGIEGVTELVPAEVGPERFPLLRRLNAASVRLRGRPFRGAGLLRLLGSLPALIRQCRPDIVHVHFAYSPWAWMAAVADHHPLVVSVMGGDVLFEEQGRPTATGRRLTLALLESADLITAKSDHLVRVLDDLGGFGAKAMKIVWGVDLKRFQRTAADELRRSLGLAPGDRIILSAKILQPFYNIHLLIDAMPRILSRCPHARLLLTEYAADSEYKARLTRQIAALGVGKHVQFVGNVPHAEMPQYYSLADVTVAVPPSDGLPQTLLEGLACEAPNVVSKLRRYEEIVTHQESAFFVDIDPESIADGVVRILTDAALRSRIVRAGRVIAEEQADLSRDVDAVEAKYYELLSAGTRRRPRYLRRARLLRDLLRYWTGAR